MSLNYEYLILIAIIIVLFVILGFIVIFNFIKKIKRNKDNNVDIKKNIINVQKKNKVKIENESSQSNFLLNTEIENYKKLNLNLEKEINNNKLLNDSLNQEIFKYKNLSDNLKSINDEQIKQLEKISNLTINEAKNTLLDKISQNLNLEKIKLIKNFEDAINNEMKDKSLNILLNTIERFSEDVVIQNSTFKFKLDDDSIKGRIIGRDGRNKKTFEMITGVDLIIEKDPEITLSCLNPIRREKARILLEKLILNKNIEPNRIEKTYQEIDNEFEKNLFEIAKQVLEVDLHIFDVDSNLYPIIGRLNYRTSYGQNILQHSKECALLASNIAIELGLDPNKAKKAAFFHDIGKALDFEMDNDHVETGIRIAKKYNLEDYVINAIASHHDNEKITNYYSAIAKIVDKISATRPGARFIPYEEYLTRVKTIEEICNSFNGVKKSYAIKAGKQVRIMINPSIINDDQLAVLSFDIKQALENNEIVNKQPIEIILIRENRVELKSTGSASRELN